MSVRMNKTTSVFKFEQELHESPTKRTPKWQTEIPNVGGAH